MTPVWLFVIWLVVPGATVPTPVMGHAATKAACERQLLNHLGGDAQLVAVSRCVEVPPWLRVLEAR